MIEDEFILAFRMYTHGVISSNYFQMHRQAITELLFDRDEPDSGANTRKSNVSRPSLPLRTGGFGEAVSHQRKVSTDG